MKSSTFKKIAAAALCAFAIVGCYKITDLSLPTEVAPGQSFSGWIKVEDAATDGGSSPGYKALGVLVPNGWEVAVPENAYEHYNTTSGSIESKPGAYNEQWTQILNQYYTREGYTWWGFVTTEKFATDLAVGNYVLTYFLITPSADAAPGDYDLEFVCGDEENELDKYFPLEEHNQPATEGSFKNCRLRETSTIVEEQEVKDASGAWVAGVFTHAIEMNTTVTVTGEAGINEINADNYSVKAVGNGQISIELNDAALANTIANVYDVNGRLIASRVLGAENVIDAAQGLCVVTLINGNKTATQKVVVK